MFTNFILQLGYVEDSLFGLLCFGHRDGFVTVTTALQDLRGHLAAYLRQIAPATCCQTAPADACYCPKCGNPLAGVHPPLSNEGEDVADLLHSLLTSTLDGNLDLCDQMDAVGWTICSSPTKDSVYISALDRWLQNEGGFLIISYPNNQAWDTYSDKPEPTAEDSLPS